MAGLSPKSNEIPEHVGILEMGLRVPLLRVDEAREEEWVSDEEDGCVVARQIPETFVRVQLDCKAARIPGRVSTSTLTTCEGVWGGRGRGRGERGRDDGGGGGQGKERGERGRGREKYRILLVHIQCTCMHAHHSCTLAVTWIKVHVYIVHVNAVCAKKLSILSSIYMYMHVCM